MQHRHAWLIGASHGMGRELAQELADRGWRLTLSARTQSTLEATATHCGARFEVLDATDRDAVEHISREIFEDHPPELVIMNVGDYEPMPLDDFDIALFEKLNRTNYLACVYLLGAVAPLMRANGGGQILLNTSAAAYRGLPNAAPYSAPKAAVLHMAEALRPELECWKINLRVINPGFVESRLTAKNPFPMPYLLTAADAAHRIARRIDKPGFEIAFPWRLIGLMKLMRCLPYALYFWIVNRMVLK